MARPPRHQAAGSIYHVTTRGNDGRRVFLGTRDWSSFLFHFGHVVESYAWECLGYCLMRNHYHGLIRLTEPNLAAGMSVLNGVWAKRFNGNHAHSGHLFERRYRSPLIESEHHLLEAVRYVPLNPVRSGVCRHPSSWRWSSHRAMAGLEPAPSFLAVSAVLSIFGDSPATARRRYVEFVDDALRAAVPGTALRP